MSQKYSAKTLGKGSMGKNKAKVKSNFFFENRFVYQLSAILLLLRNNLNFEKWSTDYDGT